MTFETLTDAHWQRALRMARSETNTIAEEIHMKLHPDNPTPGLEVRNAVHYTKNEPVGQPAYYTVMSPEGRTVIGTIEQEVDGFYYFFPAKIDNFWPSGLMHDIARKLDALNEAWHIRLMQEFDNLAATEFTPTNLPKK